MTDNLPFFAPSSPPVTGASKKFILFLLSKLFKFSTCDKEIVE